MNPAKFQITVAFDGTAYEGWQVQKIGTGVQEKIEAALAKLFPSAPRVSSSSRTDAGVHAMGMEAHFEIPESECRMTPAKLLLAINAWLPDDIRVMTVRRRSGSFHARFDASGKEYRYILWNHPVMHPLLLRRAWHCRRALNVAAMREAARHFVGRRDFRSFRANPFYDTNNTVRTLTRCSLTKQGPLITCRIVGDGFLYKMCRGIVGTLVQVGEGKIRPDEIPGILESRDRRVAGMTAPAHGLYLWKVHYREKTESAVRDERKH